MTDHHKDWQSHEKQDFNNLVSHAEDSSFNNIYEKMPADEQIRMARLLQAYKETHPGTLKDVAIIAPYSEAPVVERLEREPPATPEQVAQKIEDHAKFAVRHDAQGMLDLRKDGESLGKMDAVTQSKVIEKLQSDGARWRIFNGVPHVDEERDGDGNVTGLAFSTMGGINQDKMSLTKSVEQQKLEASDLYEKTITDGRVLAHNPELAIKEMEREEQKDRGEKPPTIGSKKWWEIDKQS